MSIEEQEGISNTLPQEVTEIGSTTNEERGSTAESAVDNFQGHVESWLREYSETKALLDSATQSGDEGKVKQYREKLSRVSDGLNNCFVILNKWKEAEATGQTPSTYEIGGSLTP